jgi:hypothetical protein
MSQTFTVSIVSKDGLKWWLTSDKGLTDNEQMAYHFKQVPPWRKTYNRFKPESVIISKSKLIPHGGVK